MLLIPLLIASIETDQDREWMANIYISHYRLMMQIAMKYAETKADADDIVSQSCVSLMPDRSI